MKELLGIAISIAAALGFNVQHASATRTPDLDRPSARKAIGEQAGQAKSLTLKTSQAIPAASAGILKAQRTLPDRIDMQADRTGGNQVRPFAIAASGEVLQEVGRNDQAGSGDAAAGLRPGRLVIVDPSESSPTPSGSATAPDEPSVPGDTASPDKTAGPGIAPMSNPAVVQEIRGAGQPGTQTVFGALNRHYAVWMEDRSTSLTVSDWTIYAADRGTGAIRTLASAKPVNADGLKPTVPGYTIPSIAGDQVYWSEARSNPDPGKAPIVNIYSRAIDASAPAELVAANAILPAATGDWLYYAGFDGETSSEGYTIYRKSLRTGATTVIHRSSAGHVRSLAGYGKFVAWADTRGFVLSYEKNRQIARVQGVDESLGWVDAGRGIVTFADNSDTTGRNYLLDLSRSRLYDLGAARGLAEVKVAGSAVMWAMGTTHQIWEHAALTKTTNTRR